MNTFDPDFLLGILFQTHVQGTISDKPPFTFKHTPSEPIETPISITEDLIGEINARAYPKYQSLGKPRSTVDIQPLVWTQIALLSLNKSYSDNEITFPNGCCTLSDCNINEYYKIVIESYLTYLKK